MFEEDNYFKEFIETRNIKKSTIQGYKSSLKLYTEYHNMSLQELIEEALTEEKQGILLKERVLKKRLIDYRKYLISIKDNKNTITSYFNKVKTFYTHHEVELPQLPSVKIDKGYEMTYHDLPTKKDIKKVCDKTTIEYRSIILFMSSSGTGKAETLSLTIRDFIDACKDYYTLRESDTIDDVLDNLSRIDNIVPTLYLRRLKTDKYYYTFCSEEASKEIIRYLQTRPNITYDDKLWDIKPSTLTSKFQELNDSMGFGFKGKYRFFRPHSLRKYHASNIGLSAEYVDALQGRRKNTIHATYIKDNPESLKKLYMEYKDNILIYDKTEESINQEFTIIVNVFLSGQEYNIF